MSGEWEVISRYTDEQGIEDGHLIDLTSLNLKLNYKKVNRITRNLWDKLRPFVKSDKNPYLPPLKKVLETKIKMAQITPDNPDGYMFILPTKIWAILNETYGYTLMLPEDY